MTINKIVPTRYRVSNNYHWLGQPATALGIVPASAGVGVSDLAHQIMRGYLQNRSASTVSLCVAGFFPDTVWEAGQWVEVGTTYTDDSTDAQDAGTNDFPINTTTI